MKKNKESNKESGNFIVFIAISSLVLILTMGMTIVIGLYADEGKRGTFGDMFGFANALFTGLSFIGLIVTILLQRKDLNTQREELKKQTNSIHIQNFENTFFQMLNLFHSLIDNLEYDDGLNLTKGRNIFPILRSKFNGYLQEIITAENIKLQPNIPTGKRELLFSKLNVGEEHITKAYHKLYFHNRNNLGHYFRTLYHIIKLVHNTPDIDKKFYISLIRAQLSSAEQILLFYNCIHFNGQIKFKPLAEKYGLFKNIDYSLLPNVNSKFLIKQSAFGKTENKK
ncbi:putative phage abortive infection protein [Chryseobacterium sp. MHB01]|uniref:putative phage abortive infection protein n=1 Tax=Chryseobacterium sp. MHB01 TaxID=3109433 RepID=UPI002AFEAEAA|nr:putative phage abortive infection protein [Chryseobacterium sp. MHB01]MEA1850189.1 putative phage abortive infection protein [Chryseobacterium sp. MHB01]